MKQTVLFLLLILGISSIWSCAKKNNSATTTDAREASETIDPLQPAESTTINMIGWRFPVTEFYAEELESFNSIENLTVSTQLLDANSVREQVRLALAGSGESPYEIVQGDHLFLTELAVNGYVISLDDYIKKYQDEYDFGDIPENLLKLGSPDGKVYGIPITANSMHYFYNMDIFEKYGLTAPDTYDEVLDIVKTLKAEEPELDIDLPFAINVHAGWAWRVEFLNFLNGFGGEWLSADGQPLFNSPEGVKALELMLRIIDESMGEKGLSWSIDDVEIGLQTGRLASATTWTSRAANMDDPTKSQFVDRIGFAPAPRVAPGMKRAAPMSADFYMIPANTNVDPEYIFRLIAEASDFESQERGTAYSLMTRSSAVEAASGNVRYASAALKSISEGGAAGSTHPANQIAVSMADQFIPQLISRRDDIRGLLDEMAEAYVKEATKQGKI